MGTVSEWQPITSVPSYKWVLLYSKEYMQACDGDKKGVMQGLYRPETENLPAEFVDDFGIKVHWNFTEWMPIPNPPEAP